MKQFAFNLFMVVFIGGLCYGGYYCLKSLTDPKKYVVDNHVTLGDLHHIDSDASSDPLSVTSATTTSATTSASSTSSATSTASSSSSVLSSALQALATQKAFLKLGSKGPAVGSVEQFMNLYFQKNSKIDNDFGKTLIAEVKKFQLQNKVASTGQVGPQTFQQMVAWLANNI